MNLVDYLFQRRSKLELAKELAQHAKDRAALQDRVGALEHELFWMQARERDEITELKAKVEELEGWIDDQRWNEMGEDL